MSAATSPAVVDVRRTIAAPPEVLFAAWLDAASVGRWMRPGATTHTVASSDPREGGDFHYAMHTPGGVVEHTGRFVVIEPHTRLVFTWNSPHAGNADSLVTVTFTPKGKATEVAIHHEKLPLDKVAAHNGGWTDALAGLDAFAAAEAA